MNIALLLLLFTGPVKHYEVINLVCTGKTGAIITNNGAWIIGITVDGDTTKGCLVWTSNDHVRDITINGQHYDKCGPTHDGITPCVVYGPKKTVDNHVETPLHDIPITRNYPEEWHKMDVPAIKVTLPPSAPCNLPSGSNLNCITGPEDHWTCEDKRRILLASEDGNKHCLLFYQ